MTMSPVVVTGFVTPAQSSLLDFQPPGSVMFIEEPDVVRKRGIRDVVAAHPLQAELVEWEYQRPGAAEAFLAARPGLHPAAVVPLVEYATPFAARLADAYGLPGAGACAADILRDKAELRRVTAAAGIANPRSRAVASAGDVEEFAREIAATVIIKPTNRQASVGTYIIDDPAAVEPAWQAAAAQDEGVMTPDRGLPLRMLVEEYVSGAEYSVEMLVEAGTVRFANVTAKRLAPGPRPIELGHVLPAPLAPELATVLRRETSRVIDCVGFATGIIHCEWIVAGAVPFLVECAGRFPGDGIVDLIERAYEYPVVRGYYDLLKGSPPPPVPSQPAAAAAVEFLLADLGEVTAIDGVTQAREVPGVVSCHVSYAVGDLTRPLLSSWDRAGWVSAVAATPELAQAAARHGAELIQLSVHPPSGGTRGPH